MRLRLNANTRKRLEQLEQSRSAAQCIGLWPTILPLDEWEALAVASQEALCNATRGRAQPKPTRPDPHDVSHKYKPSLLRNRAKVRR